MLDRRAARAARQNQGPECTICASPWRRGQGGALRRLDVVLPELRTMLPDAPDHAKGRAPIAAKKVCKLVGSRPGANWCAPCKAYRRLPPGGGEDRGKKSAKKRGKS